MRRRDFLTLASGATAWPVVARAQQPAKVMRIAMVSTSDRVTDMVSGFNRSYRAFFNELSRLGFVEGKNLVVERYSGDGQPDRFTQLARDVVGTRPDAIYTLEGSLGVVFKAATTTIPIVSISIDPVALGLVANIARPGGNVTGTAADPGIEIWGKRIGLLKEALPKLSNACLVVPRNSWDGRYGAAFRRAAETISMPLNAAVLEGKIDAAEYQRVFATFEQHRPDALLVTDSSVHFTNRVTVIELAAKSRLAALYTWRECVEIGGLMAYSWDPEEIARSCGYQIAQILNGANPGDIPFNLVTRFELALNLRTAKSLGLEFPATLLGAADLIVE
jgi:putative ABC transport system substrate-binding protein